MANKKKLSWKAEQNAAQNATEVLPALAVAFFAHGKALTPQAPPEALHSFRLQAKRLRDTLELFRPCYTPRLERLLTVLREIQQILGELNDLRTTRQLLADRGFDKSNPSVLDTLAARMAEKPELFFALWQKTFPHEREERRWVNYLAGGTFRPRKPGHKPGGT
jgi:CHAD domain-containing protein